MCNDKDLLNKARLLKLYGLIAHWDEVKDQEFVQKMMAWEEQERMQRGLARRLSDSHIAQFKPLAEFDWSWPEKCDQLVIEEIMQLEFLKEKTNVILCGPNGVGKTTIVKNIAYQTVLKGHAALFTNAGNMLNNLASQDGTLRLERRINYYNRPLLLVIDEIGYLSYSNRHADLLFEVINRRHEAKSTIITTNKPFSEWHETFPNAACVVSMIDRLVHNSEIINIEAESYRLKESQEKMKERAVKRNKKGNKQKNKCKDK